jgi:hypothetical protein
MNEAQAFHTFLLGFGQARNGANLWPPHRRQGTAQRKKRNLIPTRWRDHRGRQGLLHPTKGWRFA